MAATRLTKWDDVSSNTHFDYSRLANTHYLAIPQIPVSQYLQFRKIRTKLAIISESGYDVESLTSEQLYGASLVAPQKAKVFWSRCEYDFEVTQDVFQRLIPNMPLLKTWYTTNLTATDNRLKSVPLGLNDFCHYSQFHVIAGNLDHFEQAKSSHDRKQRILCCFNPNTRLNSRRPLIELAATLPNVDVLALDTTIAGFRKYLFNLTQYEYVLCPRGNGIDTHRFWEALYMGAVPICLKEELLPCHAGLPHVALESWSELIDLSSNGPSWEGRKQSWDLRPLCVDYWTDHVLNTLLS